MKRILFAGVAALSFACAAPALAISSINGATSTVSLDPEDPFSWNIFLTATVGNPTGATAHAIFNYLGHDAASKVFSFSYWIDNTSVAPSELSRLGQLGFDVAPKPTSGADTDATDAFKFQYAANPGPNSGNFNGLGPRNVCLYAGNNCSGAGNAGLGANDAPDTGSFTITYNAAQTGTITLSNFVGRWQATNIGSTSGGPTPGGGGVTPIPEAATWAMMLIGFGTMGGAMRRRRSQAARLQLA